MSLGSFLRSLDPTSSHSVIRRGLRELDPTRKASLAAGIGRALDVTNKNSIAGKIAPYAVGLIPGVGLPLAAGLGAGVRASQAIGRGEDLGGIAKGAVGGAITGGGTQMLASTLMPGTFAPGSVPPAPVAGMPNMALESGNALNAASGGMPLSQSLNTVANATAPLAPAGSLAGDVATSRIAPSMLNSAVATTPASAASSVGRLGGIGGFLTRQPTTIPAILQAGTGMYGAYQTGKAEDARLRMEQEQYERQKAKEKNRIGFDEWRRRRSIYQAPGSTV